MFLISPGPRRLLIALAAMIGALLPVAGGGEPCSTMSMGAGCVADCGHHDADSSPTLEAGQTAPADDCSCRSGWPGAPVPPPKSGPFHEPTGFSPSAATASLLPLPGPQAALSAHHAALDRIAGESLYLRHSRLLI